jgi:hypothetical protein
MKVCSKHPKYRGLSKPRSTCERCWQIWFGICDYCVNSGCSVLDTDCDLCCSDTPYDEENCEVVVRRKR